MWHADPPALTQLPEPVLQELRYRLIAGEKIRKVVRWLMNRPRGPFQHEGEYIIRKHVIEFRDWMLMDNKPQVGLTEDIENLSPTDRMLIRSYFDKLESGIKLHKQIAQTANGNDGNRINDEKADS